MASAPARTGPNDSPDAPDAPPRRGVRRLLHPDPVVRRLSWMVLVNTFGNGLFMTVSALYFTRVVGLGVGQVGLGLTAGGVCGVAASVPAGRAADRWGSRRVLIVLNVAEAVGMASYTLVRGFAVFLVLVCVESAVDRSGAAVRNTLYSDALPKERRVPGRAYLRAVTNVGVGAGAALAAVALEADTRGAYTAVIAGNAVTFAVVAVLLPWIPVGTGGRAAGTHAAAGEGGRRGALRDLPYLAATVLNALMALQFAVLNVGIPLWVVRETDAPRWIVAGSLLLNTVLVVALQVPATRTIRDLRSAARACRTAGVLLAGSCLVLAAAHGLPGAAAAAVLLAGVTLQVLGEVLSQAGGWLLSYDLADPRATGAYQGVFQAGQSAAIMLGPALVTATAIAHGPAGWAVLAAVFAAGGAVTVPVVRWAGARSLSSSRTSRGSA